jgi:hypothetical protein
MNALKKVADFRAQGLDSEVDDAYSCLPGTIDPRGPGGKRWSPMRMQWVGSWIVVGLVAIAGGQPSPSRYRQASHA